MDTILTYDIGGSSLRVALFDMNGTCISQERRALFLTTDPQGGCEVDPRIWWEGFCNLAAALLSTEGKNLKILAVAGSGMTRSQVFLDRDGEAVYPAMMWPDHRAFDEGQRLAELAAGGEYWSDFNAYHTLSRVLWLKNTHPACYAKACVVLEPKDYINFRLTGSGASDRISLSRILDADMAPASDLMTRAGIAPSLFPQLLWPWQVVGQARALPRELARLEGVPVLAGGMDTWCAATGTGVAAGDIYNVSGTSEVTGLLTSERLRRTGLVTLPWGEGLFQVGGPSQVGGDALKWLAEIAALPNDGDSPDLSGTAPLAALVENHPRAESAPMFIPYLRGERTPIWDDRARGCFWNLSRAHGRADLTRAVMEGVAMANRYLLEVLFGDRPFSGRVIFSGGAAKSDAWCQIKADVLGLCVVRRDAEEAGLVGAFILGLAALGRINSLDEGCMKFVKTDRVFTPNPAMEALFNRLYPHWKKVSLTMLDCHRDPALSF